MSNEVTDSLLDALKQYLYAAQTLCTVIERVVQQGYPEGFDLRISVAQEAVDRAAVEFARVAAAVDA